MDTIEFIQRQMTSLHRLLDHVVEDLNEEQLHYQHAPGVQTIAFSLWHYVRTEDNIIQFVIQRRPTVWQEGGWPEKFGLDSRAQGTGMTAAEAAALRINSLPAWRRYMREVWAATDRYLSTLTPEQLDTRQVTIKPVGEMSLANAIGGMCLTHGFRHLGEIEYARGLLGLKGATM
jgi:uncharacterized damage-inducible protein DinB